MSDRHQQLIEQYNKLFATTETRIIERINRALAVSYWQLAKDLKRKYPSVKENTNLLPIYRAELLLSQMKNLLDLTGNTNQYQRIFEDLLQTSNELGLNLAQELIRITDQDFVMATASIPLEQVKYAAEEQTRYLSRYGTEFANNASAVVEQGIIQGWGVKKLEKALQAQLGVTKVRAEMIARTASVSAGNAAAIQQYQENNMDGFIWVATVDDRVCGTCATRNGNAYRLNETRPPIHPRGRCYSTPFKFDWLNKGLIDRDWYAKFRADGIAEVEKQGKKLNYGVGGFEKGNREQPPEAIWTP